METKGHILFVEDYPDTLALMTYALERAGYQVTPVSTLTEAWEKATSEKFDLYLTNHVYPDGSGITLCKQLRKIDAHTPIIFFSARATQWEIEEGLAAGANAYLTKPADLYHVERTVAHWIE